MQASLRSAAQSDWSPFDEATNSFGQGISVTPIQMINAVAAIANGGVLLQPHIVQAMVQDGAVHYVPTHIIGRPVRPDTARKMKDMMVYDVTSSSYADFLPGYKVAGKTGTAEIPTPQGYVLSTSITSFIGFLPADNPQLVIMVETGQATEVSLGGTGGGPDFCTSCERSGQNTGNQSELDMRLHDTGEGDAESAASGASPLPYQQTSICDETGKSCLRFLTSGRRSWVIPMRLPN